MCKENQESVVYGSQGKTWHPGGVVTVERGTC